MVSTVVTVFCRPHCLVIVDVAAAVEADAPFGSLLTGHCILGVASLLGLFLSFPFEVVLLSVFLPAFPFFLSSLGGCPLLGGVVAAAAIVLAAAVVLAAAATSFSLLVTAFFSF